MASDESAFINNMLAPPMAVNKRSKRYLASSIHGDIMFENDLVAPGSMQAGGTQLMGDPLDVSSLVASIGMTPAGFEMPEGAVTAHGYNTLSGIPMDITAAPQPQIRSNNKPASFKGSWTVEEDSILRDMVMHHGEGRWSLIAQSLPGRIGKQCRERWINHLNPNIKKNDIWTVEEDMMLIRAHRSYGSHWSTIAKFLPGWPENAIKNHWNSTKRSLGSKRRLKKKKSQPVPPGQLSILEEYIRSLEPDSKSAAPQPPASPPVVNPRAVHTSAPEMEMQMHLNAPNLAAPVLHQPRAINLGNSLLPDLNISYDPQEMHYAGYPMYAPMSAPQLQLVSQDPQQDTFKWFPFTEPLTALNREHTSGLSYNVGESSNNLGATGNYNEAGPSNIGGSGDPADDTNDALELASREFFMPSCEEVSLGLDRFK